MRLITTIHGIYCDSTTAEHGRLNVLDICYNLRDYFTSTVKSELINNHSDYIAKGSEDKHIASQQFFEKLGLLGLLNDAEKHDLFYRAIKRLWDVHNGMNNFYNEPPFAERLLEITSQEIVPEVTQDFFVQTVMCCRIGNGYGISNAAEPFYDEIIQSFSPAEIATLMSAIIDSKSHIFRRISDKRDCRTNLKNALKLIDINSVPNSVKVEYSNLIR